jgi:hypothetical protein
MCICFFLNPGYTYGTLFAGINNVGTWVLLIASLIAYVSDTPKRWTCGLIAITTMCLVVFNLPWLIYSGGFLTGGFMLIAYDLLHIVANLHFLGIGL